MPLNFDSAYSINYCLTLIKDNLETFRGFDSEEGELAASIKHTLFGSSEYTEPVSNTRILIGKLLTFIEENSLPEERVKFELSSIK